MILTLLFIASFFQVFLLGLNSQFVRNQWVSHVFIVSWFISLSQFTYTKIVAMSSGNEMIAAYLATSLGSSLGIVCSIYFYRWLSPKIRNKPC